MLLITVFAKVAIDIKFSSKEYYGYLKSLNIASFVISLTDTTEVPNYTTLQIILTF